MTQWLKNGNPKEAHHLAHRYIYAISAVHHWRESGRERPPRTIVLGMDAPLVSDHWAYWKCAAYTKAKQEHWVALLLMFSACAVVERQVGDVRHFWPVLDYCYILIFNQVWLCHTQTLEKSVLKKSIIPLNSFGFSVLSMLLIRNSIFYVKNWKICNPSRPKLRIPFFPWTKSRHLVLFTQTFLFLMQ